MKMRPPCVENDVKDSPLQIFEVNKTEHLEPKPQMEFATAESDEVKKAISNIRIAWVGGFLIGILWLIMGFLPDTRHLFPDLMFSASIIILSYGIYKRSRVCSIIMLTIWVMGILFSAIHAEILMALVGIAICYPCYKGFSGTFAYHKLAK
ncbi:MAG: hypothetical protein ACLP2P_15510 [Desulfobaccales bacterium]